MQPLPLGVSPHRRLQGRHTRGSPWQDRPPLRQLLSHPDHGSPERLPHCCIPPPAQPGPLPQHHRRPSWPAWRCMTSRHGACATASEAAAGELSLAVLLSPVRIPLLPIGSQDPPGMWSCGSRGQIPLPAAARLPIGSRALPAAAVHPPPSVCRLLWMPSLPVRQAYGPASCCCCCRPWPAWSSGACGGVRIGVRSEMCEMLTIR